MNSGNNAQKENQCMERVIELLKEKNLYLEKFHFVNEQEILNFEGGNFESVEPFYQTRDKILDLVRCIDGLIDEEQNKITSPKDISVGHRTEVEQLLRSKDEVVKSILAQDLQIMTYIEEEKSNIIRELRATGTARKAVGAYANTERLKQQDEL